MTKIYISAPFKTFTNDIENRFYGVFSDKEYQEFLEAVDDLLTEKGFETCLPHRDEGLWGEAYILPEDIAEICFRRIRDCDIFLCFPGTSRGVHIEVGYAAALHKEIIVLLPEGERESTLLRGLDKVTTFDVERYSTKDEAMQILDRIFADK